MKDYKASKETDPELQTTLLGYAKQELKPPLLEKKVVPRNSADKIPPPQHEDPVIFTSSPVRPLPQVPVNVEPHLPTIFGQIPERCMTFCIDTSGSMFYALDVVKEHLIETLSILEEQDNNCLFNIIEFNTDATKWSDKMVHCTPETVAAAKLWVSNLAVKTGTNTQDALFTALNDPDCQAVYLVTDDIPDGYTEEVVDNIVVVCGRCRIHCIYISNENVNEDAIEFLEDLAVATCGSIHIVTLTSHGCLDRITPIYRADHSRGELVQTLMNTLQSSLKACSIPTTLKCDPEVECELSSYPKSSVYPPFVYLNTLPHSLKPYYWPTLYLRNMSLKEYETFRNPLLNCSLAAGSLLTGKRVIARRKQDGYFYRATIKSQISRDTFLVAFPPCRHYNLYQIEYEDVSISDIVDCTTQNQTISTGDRILAPCDTEEDRFAPGIVVEKVKQAVKSLDKYTFTVCFNDGQVKQVPEDAVVLIPPILYDRFTQEKQMSVTFCANRPTVDYKVNSIKYHSISPLAVKSSSYPWNSAIYGHPSFLPAHFEYAPFVINQKEGLIQGLRKDNPFTFALPQGIDLTNLKVQDERQENKPSYEEKSQGVVDDKMYPERAVTFCKPARLLARKEKQKETFLRNLVQLNTNERSKESKPEEINYYDDFNYSRSVSQIQKMYSGKGDDSTKHFILYPGHEDEKTWKKVLLSNPCPHSSELSVSPTEKVENSSCTGPSPEIMHRSSLRIFDQNHLYRNVKDNNTKLQPTAGQHSVSNSGNSFNIPLGERIHTDKGKRFKHLFKPEAQEKERIAKKTTNKKHQQDDIREIILSQMEKDRHQKILEQVSFQQAHLSRKKRN